MARRDDDDDMPWLAEGVREQPATFVPRARLFGGALIAALLAVLVALGVYFASGHKSDGSGGYARPEDAPLIAADPGPYKVAPVDPGGARITGIDDTIAATAAGRDPASALLPDTAEEPLARPVAGAPTAPAAPPPTDLLPATPRSDAPPRTDAPPRAIAAAPVVAPKAEVGVPLRAAPAASPALVATAKAKADPSAAKPAAKADAAPAKSVEMPKPDQAKADAAKSEKAKSADATPSAAKPARPDSARSSDGAGPRAKTKMADDPAPDAAARATKVDPGAPAKASGGAVTLQLGAFSTRDKADAAWSKAGGDGALGGLTKRVETIERDGTTLYRLRAGGVASKDAARALCARLKAAGAACIVAD